MHHRVVALFVLVLATFVVSCGGTPVSPTVPIVPDGPVMAPPPAGVSPGVWRVAFNHDGRLYRPDVVHLVLPADAPESTKRLFASVAEKVTETTHGKTLVDTIPDPSGANNHVMVLTVPDANRGIPCGEWGLVSACAKIVVSGVTGKVKSGTVEFATANVMNTRLIVEHEVYRTLGLLGGLSPKPGVMGTTPLSEITDEERTMILGRYDYPLLSVYSPQ